MSKSRVLFIAYHYPPVGGMGVPGVQRTVKFIRHLAAKEIYVLTVETGSYPRYFSLDSEIQLPIKGEKIYRAAVVDLFGFVLKVRGFFRKKSKESPDNSNRLIPNISSELKKKNIQKIKDVISTLMTFPDFASPWLIPAILKGIKIVRKEKVNVIFATGMPWTSLIVGSVVKVVTGKKLVVDFRDPWVDNPFIKRTRLEKYLERKCESFVVKKADIVTANTGVLRLELIERYPQCKDKVIHLPNGYDEQDFCSVPHEEISKTKLVITHAGFLYGRRDPYCLIEAIKTLQETHPDDVSDVQFQFIGNVDLGYDIKSICSEKGVIDHFIFLPQMEYKKCIACLKNSDVLLVIQQGTKSQIPSKIYEYIFLEKPIISITDQDGALGQLIRDNAFGRVFQASMVNEIARHILFLARTKKTGKSLKVNYKNKAKYDIEKITIDLQNKVDALFC